jgi:hypothetical protein
MAARTFVPASDRRPADLRRAINAQIGLLTADYFQAASDPASTPTLPRNR